jgi:hypothetical protein
VEEAIEILDELPECMKPPRDDGAKANSAGATASYSIMIDQAFANHGDKREWYMLHDDSDRGKSLRDKVTIHHLLELARLAKEEIQKAITEAYEEKGRIEQNRMEKVSRSQVQPTPKFSGAGSDDGMSSTCISIRFYQMAWR